MSNQTNSITDGARHGYIDVDQVLRGADATAAHVSKLADQHRIRISENLIEPLENEAVTFIPDLWSDPVHQVSYLGVSATFVNDRFEYRSYDLCCSPFEEEDKTAENILVALQKASGKFNINDLSTLQFVTDRGSNFVKAMKNYSSYFCFAHRLNNILVLGFYQNESIKKQTKAFSDMTGENETNSDGIFNCCSLNNDTDGIVLINMSKTKVQDLPDCVREILKVLNNCKDVVKYVKLNGLNKNIQSEGGFSLCQSSKIRWLSIMELLGSIDRSFKETKKVLQEKKKSFLIDRLVIKRLIHSLRPFKHILTIAQKGNEPSLYLVLICVMTLRKALSSFENLVLFNRENDDCNDVLKKRKDNGDDEYDIEVEEPDGIRFFRLRLLELLESMFILEPIHFAATFLHPRYRYLRKCSTAQVDSCKSYVRRQLKEIVEREKVKRLTHSQESQRLIRQGEKGEPPLKKKKRFGQEYEASNLSDEYNSAEDDEVEKYLSMFIDSELLVDNPLVFWKTNQNNLPLLSKLARMIHYIPATTTSVEREFSVGGLVMTERRSSINPDNLNNILFVRSVTR
ncbi:unnamed protein product [Adineta ricciae]|uniref:HAT C-terminal dimerisation domain-containing protein n=1 Tax=Adineta ricciae TaxID=249248 RepID=A0A815PJS4_ADIRI|nr:unnamed protein product [Adineta ricciae]CAF1488853.1 unnamed protein product [Adineta ricciae]